MDALKETVNHIILDPQYADVLSIVKAARNGAVYGAKRSRIYWRKGAAELIVPRKHSMVFLFRSGTIREKLRLILKATRQHSRNLATFAVIHKSTLLALRHFSPFNNAGKEGRYDTFLAGLIGGYAVFGRGKGAQSSVNQQISIYVFARVVLALAKLS
ncbi:MAG: hypothetical protein M1830_006290, partial [Pleopsidium flavum]